MAANGALTITGEEYLLDGLRKISANPNDYGTLYDTVNAGKADRTKIVAAVRLENGKDSIDIPLSPPSFIVQALPVIFRNAVEYKPASHLEALQLEKAAKEMSGALNPASPSPPR